MVYLQPVKILTIMIIISSLLKYKSSFCNEAINIYLHRRRRKAEFLNLMLYYIVLGHKKINVDVFISRVTPSAAEVI